MRLLRSYLFAPGNHAGLLEKVFRAGADAVVLDLEDAVPASDKDVARHRVGAAVIAHGRANESGRAPALFVRINGLDSPHWRDDVAAVLAPGIHGIRVPKAETLESICRLNDVLSEREAAAGIGIGTVAVVATVESARGLANLADLAGGPRVSGFAFGAADFCADIGADPTASDGSLLARSSLVSQSRVRRLLPPISSVYTRLHDDSGLRADTASQKAMGFFGRSAIHPRQLAVIHDVFNPTSEEVAAATAMIKLAEAAREAGSGALVSGGDFVDVAVLRRARATIELDAALRKGQHESE